MLSVVVDDQARAGLTLDLDELVREGARRMLAAALEAEVDAYLADHAELVDADGHRLVVRNGHAPPASLRPPPVRSRSSAPGSTTAAPTPPPASECSSTA